MKILKVKNKEFLLDDEDYEWISDLKSWRLVGNYAAKGNKNIYLNGKNIKHMSDNSLAILRGETIGFIFQQFNLLPTFTALENVIMPMELVDKPEKESKERAEDCYFT